jgi:hypothetical protein
MLLDREVIKKLRNGSLLNRWRYYSSKVFLWYNVFFIFSLSLGMFIEYNFHFTAPFFNKVSSYLEISTTPVQYSHVLTYFKSLLGKI